MILGTQFTAVSQTGFATTDPNAALFSDTAPPSAWKDLTAVQINKEAPLPAQHKHKI